MNTRKVDKTKIVDGVAYKKKKKILEQMQIFQMASQILRRWSDGEID